MYGYINTHCFCGGFYLCGEKLNKKGLKREEEENVRRKTDALSSCGADPVCLGDVSPSVQLLAAVWQPYLRHQCTVCAHHSGKTKTMHTIRVENLTVYVANLVMMTSKLNPNQCNSTVEVFFRCPVSPRHETRSLHVLCGFLSSLCRLDVDGIVIIQPPKTSIMSQFLSSKQLGYK